MNFTYYRTKCKRAGEEVTGICVCVIWYMGTLKMWAAGSSRMLSLDVTSQKIVLLQLPTVTGAESHTSSYVQRIQFLKFSPLMCRLPSSVSVLLPSRCNIRFQRLNDAPWMYTQSMPCKLYTTLPQFLQIQRCFRSTKRE